MLRIFGGSIAAVILVLALLLAILGIVQAAPLPQTYDAIDRPGMLTLAHSPKLDQVDGDDDSIPVSKEVSDKLWLDTGYPLYHPSFPKNYYGYTATLYLHNTASISTTVFLEFDDIVDHSGITSVTRTIPASGTLTISSDKVWELSNGHYGLVVQAEQPLESSVHLYAPPSLSVDRLAMYRGQGEGSTTQYFGPFFGKGNSQATSSPMNEPFVSALLLWNISSAYTDFTIYFYTQDGTLAFSDDANIAPGKQFVYSGADMPGLPVGFSGIAIVTSSQPIVGLLTLISQNSDPLEYYETYGALSIGTQAFMPRALKAFDEGGGARTTALIVANTTITQTDVTISLDNATGTIQTYESELELYSSWIFDLGDEEALSNGSLWSAVAIADQPLAIGEFTSYDAAPFHSNGVYESLVGTRLHLPGIIRQNKAHTVFSVQNTGVVAAALEVNFYDTMGNLIHTQSETLPPWSSLRFDQSQMPELGDVFEGSAAILSDQPVRVMNEMFDYRGETGPTTIYLPSVLRNYDPRLPYSDDFSDPSSGWFVGDSIGDVRFSYQNGEYEILLQNADWWWDGMLAPLGCVTDYSLEANMRRYAGSTTGYGFVFGLEDWDHLYAFIVEPGYQAYSLWRRVFPGDPIWVPLVDWTPSPYINLSEATNHLQVEHSGNRITIFVNGQHLTAVTDSAYTGCLQVGLFASTDPVDSDVPAAVRYDNFQIRQLGTGTSLKDLIAFPER